MGTWSGPGIISGMLSWKIPLLKAALLLVIYGFGEAAEGAQLALLSLSRSSGTRAYHNNIVLHSLWAITCVHTCATEALNKSPFPCVQCSH